MFLNMYENQIKKDKPLFTSYLWKTFIVLFLHTEYFDVI